MVSEPNCTLSIVVPVHNMAGRLGNLESAVKKSREFQLPIQFILIQDGKDVETQNELNALAGTYGLFYRQIDVSSPGLARNAGIELCTSEWVTFWDSDDLGNPFEVVQAIQNAPAGTKVVVGSYREFDSNSGTTSKVYAPSKSINYLMLNPGIWRFAFKRDFISNKRFPEESMGEDQVFLAKLKIDTREWVLSKTLFYTYFTNVPNQLTSSPDKVMELKSSLFKINEVADSISWRLIYIYVIRAKLYLTAYKKNVITGKTVIESILGNSGDDLQNRLKCFVGYFMTCLFLLKQAMFVR